MPTRVVVVRHGARLDEEDRQLWHKIRTQATKADPPLTQRGWEQAHDAGKTLQRKVLRPLTPPNVVVYSSPTARTLSTAAGVAKELGVSAVTPAYALNCCAAAQSYGVVAAFPKDKPGDDTMAEIQLTCWPPIGDEKAVNKRLRSGSFVETVKELASLHHDDELVVLVTHREGIWELQNHVQQRAGAQYCSLTYVNYDSESNKLSSWTPETQQTATRASRSRGASQRRSTKKDSSVIVENAEQTSGGPENSTMSNAEGVETLESVLARGSGQIVLHRGGRGGANATLLWCTPGVRGKWVNGGGVPDGEVLTLLSTPQASEGDEGDFVLVQRACGTQGWTKVKNVRLTASGAC